MTYGDAMRIAIQSCNGSMEDMESIARGLMCQVDTIAQYTPEEDEIRHAKEEHGNFYFWYV